MTETVGEPLDVAVVRELVSVGAAFTRITADLRALPDVVETGHPIRTQRIEELVPDVHFTVGSGSGFAIEWCAFAEFSDDRGLTFAAEVRWCGGRWTVDAEILRHDRDGGHPLFDFPPARARSADELVAGLRKQTAALVEHYERAVGLFLGDR